ncbi:hypothetical protein Pmani_038672 [Petrolisthes manimaculis]|uniref:Uncharacterized protein n=1 Tax=Petrolisthes manimaculis TaxID=1843537 RepID=A0AAE1TK65_9EUCA|nr:hypothetical protein Pmani_038672 [Petrolisthes manimaculis]
MEVFLGLSSGGGGKQRTFASFQPDEGGLTDWLVVPRSASPPSTLSTFLHLLSHHLDRLFTFIYPLHFPLLAFSPSRPPLHLHLPSPPSSTWFFINITLSLPILNLKRHLHTFDYLPPPPLSSPSFHPILSLHHQLPPTLPQSCTSYTLLSLHLQSPCKSFRLPPAVSPTNPPTFACDPCTPSAGHQQGHYHVSLH